MHSLRRGARAGLGRGAYLSREGQQLELGHTLQDGVAGACTSPIAHAAHFDCCEIVCDDACWEVEAPLTAHDEAVGLVALHELTVVGLAEDGSGHILRLVLCGSHVDHARQSVEVLGVIIAVAHNT